MTVFFKTYVMFLSKKKIGFSQTHWGKKEVPTNFEPTQRIILLLLKGSLQFEIAVLAFYFSFLEEKGICALSVILLSMEYLFCLRSEAHQIWGTSFS